MKLFCYKAMCGDAFHLHYEGESGRPCNILLDMGRQKTYKLVLKDVISNLIGSSEHIDALFLSHIHDDHIGGASGLIKDIQLNDSYKSVVRRWIYNVPRRYVLNHSIDTKDGVLCGIVSGDKVYEHIISQYPTDLNDVVEGQTFDIEGLKVKILSPNMDKLNKLREKYSNNRPLCKSETDEASVEAGCVADDYSIPLDRFKIDVFQEDTSIENASSIAAILEFKGKRILWLSDSVPSVVVNSLSKLGYSEIKKIHCDAVLLSHHGSSANNSLDLFRMISADRFIISADGINRHCLPNKETIARIVSASSVQPISLYFNYCDGRLMRMFNSDDLESLRSMIYVHYLNDKEVIEL